MLPTFYKSYRFKIVISFILVLTITFFSFIGYNYFSNKVDRLRTIETRIAILKSKFLSNKNNFQSFLLHGYKSPSFNLRYNDHTIDGFLKGIDSQIIDLKDILADIKKNDIKLNNSLTDSLVREFRRNKTLAETYKSMQYDLGYRDYGKIGNMRIIAHDIEDEQMVQQAEILQLRRHEKDFLLRTDSLYVNAFNQLIDSLLDNNGIEIETYNNLASYKNFFSEVVNLKTQLGNREKGLRKNLLQSDNDIKSKISEVEEITQIEVAKKKATIDSFLSISGILCLAIVIILVIYLSRLLTRDIKRLQKSMHNFIDSDFKIYDLDKDREGTSKISEIDFLYKAYGLLKENLLKNINGLQLTIEELERTTAYKSSFLANMSHEIRTPLNGIMGVLNLFKQTKTNREQQNLLEIADYSSSHLLGLINLILDYSKISAGQMDLEIRPINIKSDLSKLIKIFNFQASEKRIDLKYNYEINSGASPLVYGDSVRINQIIINLLNNAIKFTDSGWVNLEIVQTKLNDQFDNFLFTIEDTGIGIDGGKLETIFQAFQQEDISITRKFGGTGLGLSISNELAHLMGSELKFKAKKSQGSLFYFNLRLERSSDIVTDYDSSNILKRLDQINSELNVLVVDDNVMNQKVLGMMLKKMKINLDYASNGLEAIERYKKNEYHLIFMDIQMPIMDGLEATKKIRKTNKFNNNPIPIIAVSASAYTDDRKLASEAGIDDFISKPIDAKKLQDLLIKHSFAEV